MEKLLNLVKNNLKILKIKENLFEIKIPAKISIDIPIKIYIEETEDGIKLTDKKNIIKSMNEIYDLNSKDVKKCLNDILSFYNFSLSKGEIYCFVNEENIMQNFYNFIMCYSQLLNMFIFFDE